MINRPAREEGDELQTDANGSVENWVKVSILTVKLRVRQYVGGRGVEV